MGFTVVDVNMRGTGCSGGAFDFFEPLQSLDGYDVVETIARQPWVANGKVGMMGISYGGISQLFTAQTQPPSLAAITPLSVIDNTQTTLYPGGILNTGFALEWAKDRIHDAQPASPDGGQQWAYERIQEGDTTCAENQAMHGEARNLLEKIQRNDHYRPKVADPLAPVTFVDKINVPVFMACQWEDEQTGGHCPTLAEAHDRDRPEVVHVHQRHPRRLARPRDLQPLVRLPQALRGRGGAADRRSPLIRSARRSLRGGDGDRGRDPAARPDPAAADLRGALAAFEELDPVRILFDNGAGGSQPGAALPGLRAVLLRVPGPGNAGRVLVPGPGRRAARARRLRRQRRRRLQWDAEARPPTNFTGDTGAGEGGLWTADARL